MDIHLEGATRLNASREAVLTHLTDPRLLADVIPGKKEVRIVDESRVEAMVAVVIPEAKGGYRVEFAVADTALAGKARVVGMGEGAGSSLRVTSRFDLLGDSPTWMHWTADAEVDGTMGSINQSRLKRLADAEVEEIFDGLTRAVEKQAGL